MKTAIVGAGAIGSLFGGLLARSGEDVLLLDNHPERAEKVSREGLRFEGISGEMVIPICATSRFEDSGGADLFLICVKSYSTEAAGKQIAPFVKNDSIVMTLQNGIGNVEKLCEIFSREQVMAGTTSQGANVRGIGHIHHAGRGDTAIGELDGKVSERANRTAEIFTRSGIPTRVSENVTGLLWGKLLINVGINPLTAILRIRNGEILNRPPAVALMHRAVLEAYRVCTGKGIKLEFADPIKKVEEVAMLTKDNISSMHQDVRAGKRTEIDAICGAVVDEGKAIGIETPINEMLWNIVKAIEERYGNK
ncbi:MAG: ketopantoate reductase family protein [bacterium]